MQNLEVFKGSKHWKLPLHIGREILARFYLRILPNLEIIGITGSVGKTLTQNAIDSVLSQKFNVVVGDENLDPTFRIPQTILKARPWHQKIVLEYGVEKPGEMDYYLSIAKPKIAVVTVISKTHTKYFGDIDGVYREKLKLVKALGKDGYAILNADDPNVVKMANETRATIKWFGQKAKDSIKISHFSQNLKGSKFRLHYEGQKASVSWKVVGRHQLNAAYAAGSVGLACGLTLKQIAKGLSQIKAPEHRLIVVSSKKANIIDDTYNSSPKAAQESLKTFLDLGKRKQKIAVFGEMKDLGTSSLEEHKLLGEKIAKTTVNYLITVGNVASVIGQSAKKAKFKGKIINVSNVHEAMKAIRRIFGPRSLILIKGSRHAHLERLVSALTGKSTAVDCYHCGLLS